MNPVLYFAYGSNLDDAQMRDRCADARVVGRATLPNYALVFGGFSHRWGGAVASVGILTSQYGVMFALRLALVFLGAGVFGLWLYRTALRPGAETLLGRLAWTAFALVFVSEVLGRFLFYATHVKIGL